MHILIIPSEPFVTPKTPLGGIFQYEQAVALAAAGNSVGVLSSGLLSIKDLLLGYPYNKSEEVDNIKILRAYSVSLIPRRFIFPERFQQLQITLFKKIFLEYISRNGLPDIVHAHNILFAGVIARWIKEEYGIPFLLTEHSSAFKKRQIPSSYDQLMLGVIQSASFLSCVSCAFADVLYERFSREFQVLHNIVDGVFFDNSFSEKNITSFIFINVAALDENKNQELILKSFAKYFKGSSAQLKIAGDGPLKDRLLALAKTLGIIDQVFFLGQLPRRSLARELLNANCFVLSSNYETFGVVLIEALASGIPLIATKSGGPEEVINNTNGLLVDVQSVEQFSDAMLYMYENSADYDPISLRSGAYKRFGAHAFVDRVMNIYRCILAS